MDNVATVMQITGVIISRELHAGTIDLITSHPSIASDAHTDPGQPLCRKNIGKKRKLRKWSRGHQFIIRGGGHIDAWQPLFQ